MMQNESQLQLKCVTASEAELKKTVELQRKQVAILLLVILSCVESDFAYNFSSVTHLKTLTNWKKRELFSQCVCAKLKLSCYICSL